VFNSFFIAGFECATHRRRDGVRVDSIAAQQHDRFALQDYRLARQMELATARDGLRWHLIEPSPGAYDWSSWRPMLQAAREADVQVIWDLWHYGTPDWLDIFSPAFVNRIAAFARAAAEIHRAETDQVPLWCPLNEINFYAFIAGEVPEFHPYASGRAHELKRQLVRAGVAMVDALRQVDARARIVWCEPAINVLPDSSSADDVAAARTRHLSQFEAFDMLSGSSAPELGGREDILDIIGLNFYPHNQSRPTSGAIPLGHHAWRPFGAMLKDFWTRYRRPLFVAETGAENCGRAAWLHYVCGEVEDAIEGGVLIDGICWYPVTDYHGWDDGRACPTGLFSSPDGQGRREVHVRLARELRRQQEHFGRLIPGKVRQNVTTAYNQACLGPDRA
jgi:beta-glucosidase/6-phospho-beta-glucosidase/beta-galactosidase